jgi:ABC-type polysaccharide/polyol phosphate export permease
VPYSRRDVPFLYRDGTRARCRAAQDRLLAEGPGDPVGDLGMIRVAEYLDARELTWNLTLRELRGKYKRSVLGWTWSLLNPLATVLIFSLVFRLFLKIDPPVGDPSGLHNFAMFLLCGLLAWNFLSSTMTQSMDALVGNGNLIKKVYFPREVLVVATVAALLVSFLIELGVLIVLLLVIGNMVLPWIPALLLIVTIEAVFALGIALMLSVLNVYFRDVKHLMTIVLQALFYTAPIVYPLKLVPETADLFGWEFPLLDVYRLNPIVRMLTAYRDILYDLRFPPAGDLLYFAAWAAGTLLVGLWVFNRLEGRLAEEV